MDTKTVDHCVKSVRIMSYSGPHFPAFGLNTERYFVTPYSVLMRENTDQNISEYGLFYAVPLLIIFAEDFADLWADLETCN